ncbi:hypothetical protein pb186bvf_010323 [Paramecium bursaria]
MKDKRFKQRKQIIQRQPSIFSNFKYLITLAIIAMFIGTAFIMLMPNQKNEIKSEDPPKIEHKNKQKYNGEHEVVQQVSRNVKHPIYTQGLVFKNETHMVESGGLYRKSSIQYIDINNPSEVINLQKLHNKYFGEGCDIIDGKLYQLTWKERDILQYDLETLEYQKTITLDSQVQEGWGLTHRYQNKKLEIIISDGTSNIYIADSEFNVKNIVQITYPSGDPTYNMNELEYVDGILYANIYVTNTIVAIDLSTGKVVREYDFTDLHNIAKPSNRADCLNGIAYNKETDTFWITGKLWPYFWEVKLK